MNHLRPMIVLGTRPEAVKVAPIVTECLRRLDHVSPIIVFSGQHREMLRQVTDYFGIEPDVTLDVMSPGQSLAQLTSRCLAGLDDAIAEHRPDCVVAQGDTATVFASSLAAFFRGVPFVHVEAGLRTGDLSAPFPEEYHRRVVAVSATLHCAPTRASADHLLEEGVNPDDVRVTGNTVIDALLEAIRRERNHGDHWREKHAYLGSRDMVLITAHRRENHGDGLTSVFDGIASLSRRFPQVEFVFPVHQNPNVRGPAHAILGGLPNVRLLEPSAYPEFVWLMDRSKIIISDSGGVQEEAPSLHKPVLVTRDQTERPEALEAGALALVGADSERLVEAASRLLTDENAFRAMQIESNPYGDGRASVRIVDWMLERFRATDSSAVVSDDDRKRVSGS